MEKFIDLEKVIGSKNPKLLKYLPRFAMNYLNRIIHVDQLNKAIWDNREKFGLDFVAAILTDLGYTVNGIDAHYLKECDRFMVASNHPLGGLDGLALMHEVGQHTPDITFPVNDLLLNLPNLKQLFIPINKHSNNTSDNVRLINNAFASDHTILYFPAGLCSRKISGKIADLEWKKTFVAKARSSRRSIIPAYIDSKNSNFFYNLANIRKSLGIKGNIEMLYLVDEMYNQKNKTINITFGKPIPYEMLTSERTDREWAVYIRNLSYGLKNTQA